MNRRLGGKRRTKKTTHVAVGDADDRRRSGPGARGAPGVPSSCSAVAPSASNSAGARSSCSAAAAAAPRGGAVACDH